LSSKISANVKKVKNCDQASLRQARHPFEAAR
jgi:hypothetical protein